MPSLSEKLNALGVKIGANDFPAPLPQKESEAETHPIEKVLEGSFQHTHQGDVFMVEARYPEGKTYGRAALAITASLHILGRWAGNPQLQEVLPQGFAFIDTETTGLSGGTGTYAFLIGVGRFENKKDAPGSEFHLAQFFLRDPIEEPAQLIAFEEFLAPCQAMVTFNGKAFDVPLLSTRFTTYGWRSPFAGLAHVDLLHLARRLWRERLPSRTLSNLEAQIMGAIRSEEDVPGWMIPDIYFNYLRDGDARPLQRVFYHNAMDVLSLAALLDHTANLLADPLNQGNQYGVDLIALARLFEDLGDIETAADLYLHGLEHEDALTERLPRSVFLQAIQRLALIHKRKANWQEAIKLWKQAARYHHLDSHLELAKCFEHSFKDYPEAIYWTQSAIDLLQVYASAVDLGVADEFMSMSSSTGSSSIEFQKIEENNEGPVLSEYERRQWLENFQHRLSRLQRKLHGS